MAEEFSRHRPSLKINALSNWASLAVNIAVGFLLTPFIIRELGKTGYGIWTLVGSFIGYYGLLNLGVGSAITRYIAFYSAQKDKKALNEVASTVLAMFCVTGVLAIAVTFAFAGVIADFFNIEPQQQQAFIRLIWIIGITTGISFPGNVFGAIVTAREHYVAMNCVTITRALLRAGLTVLFINMGWGLLGVGLAPLAATAMAIISSFFLFEHYASDVHLRLAFANKRTLKILLVYGGITTVIAVADILRFNLDSFVIGKYVDLDAVGVYGVAALIIRYITVALGAGMSVLLPRFSFLEGADKFEEIRRLFLRALKISAFMSFGFFMFAICFGPRFIVFWVGDEYAKARLVLIVLSAAYAFGTAQIPSLSLMYALNKHHIFAVLTIVEGLFNLILSLLLVRRYGIIGVALGTAIPLVVVQFLVKPFIICRWLRIDWLRYAKPLFTPCLFCSLIMVLFFLADLTKVIDAISVGIYFPLVVFSVLVYFGFGGLFYFSGASVITGRR